MNLNIEKIVEKYLTYYPKEKDNLIKLKDFIKKENNICNSKNIVGHLTASGYIYAKKEQKILLLEHRKAKKFVQPGGHVEIEDETLLDTAKREIYEETKLKNLELISISSDKNVPFDINTHFISENPEKDMPAHYHHDFRYLFAVNKIEEIKIDINESKSYKWFAITELKNNIEFKKVVDNIYERIKLEKNN